MNTLLNITEKYIEYCETQKCLNSKTLKAYCTDLNQFIVFLNNPYIQTISISDIDEFSHRSTDPFSALTVRNSLFSVSFIPGSGSAPGSFQSRSSN